MASPALARRRKWVEVGAELGQLGGDFGGWGVGDFGHFGLLLLLVLGFFGALRQRRLDLGRPF